MMISSPLFILGLATLAFFVAYRVIGHYLATRVFQLNDNTPVPAHTHYDGQEFVPSPKSVMFGHHFTSIAGTGPIVGPAIGIIWGWVPAVLWVCLGAIFMGAVHDFGSLVLSMRHQGQSLSAIAGTLLHPRAKRCFFLIVALALWIVMAIFGLIIALVFAQFPSSVLAVWLEIPIAVVFGVAMYRARWPLWLITAVAVLLLYGCVYLGVLFPISLPAIGSWPATGTWTVILLLYAAIASVVPVTRLLQPRDYLNAWQLYVALACLCVGVVGAAVVGQLHFAAPPLQLQPQGAPPLWPFLFVTIACGALSGFHCLICSGTSAKQLNKESDARLVGYGSMLLESFLAMVVIIAVGAGLGMGYQSVAGEWLTGTAAFAAHYDSWQASSGLGSKLSAVVVGSANMMGTIGIPYEWAVAIVGVFIASFAGTTLDSATRVQRYIIAECARSVRMPLLANKYVATAVAVLAAAFLAFSSGTTGNGALALWPLFGAVNQLLGGLALLLIGVYIAKRSRRLSVLAFGPCVFILCLTLWASLLNHQQFLATANTPLLILNGLIVGLAILIMWDACYVIKGFITKRAIR